MEEHAYYVDLNGIYDFKNCKNTSAAKSLQSCTTLCDPIDGSPPGSPVPWILQARTLEWVAITLSTTYHRYSQKKKKAHILISISLK